MSNKVVQYVPFGISKYDEQKHCASIIEVMESGNSHYHFCEKEEICETTFKTWVKTKPEFSKAYRFAKTRQRASFHSRLLDAQDNPGANITAILAAAKIVGGMSVNRTVRLKGYKSKGDFSDHYKCLLNNLASGVIDIPEAKAIAEVLLVGVKLDENTDQRKRIEALEAITRMKV